MATNNSPIGRSWENGYDCPYCGKSIAAQWFSRHTKKCEEKNKRIKCNDCPADAELSGFGVRLCETCYQNRLRTNNTLNNIHRSLVLHIHPYVKVEAQDLGER